MKYTKQSPVYVEDEKQPHIKNETLYGYILKKAKNIENNPFVAMCKFEENVMTMTFESCNLFKRSFTTKGLGYTFNNEVENKLIKDKFRATVFLHKSERQPSLMKSTGSKHSLTVVIDSNAEEVEKYEKTKKLKSLREDDIAHKPQEVEVSLHNPKEPADINFFPATNVRIPLGYRTTFYITPSAREIDESGKALTEFQRNCRLDEQTEDLDIFNVYSKVACLFECNMKLSMKRCGCVPWNFPININDKVNYS